MDKYFRISCKLLIKKYAIYACDLYDLLCQVDDFILYESDLQTRKKSKGIPHTHKMYEPLCEEQDLDDVLLRQELIRDSLNEFHTITTFYLNLRDSGFDSDREKSLNKMIALAHTFFSIHQMLTTLRNYSALFAFLTIFDQNLEPTRKLSG